jgi:hypothetical protein
MYLSSGQFTGSFSLNAGRVDICTVGACLDSLTSFAVSACKCFLDRLVIILDVDLVLRKI